MEKLLKRYSDLIIKKGVNVQQNQMVVIRSQVSNIDLVNALTRSAYEHGAGEVRVDWASEDISKLAYLMADDKVFDEFPRWRAEFFNEAVERNACFISITSEDPEGMDGVDSSKISRSRKAAYKPMKNYYDKMIADELVWCVVGAASPAWAKKVFPELNEKDAVIKLWDAIFEVSRVNLEDPIDAWQKHQESLTHRCNVLNQMNIKTLHYKNSIGTDVIVELPLKYRFDGGSSQLPSGLDFIPNIPTEEVFTLPKRDGVNGVVVSSLPLNYNGQLIQDFKLVFKQGKVVEFEAKQGYEALKAMLEADEGAAYLGEVALVPYHSPISMSKILFYNTLYDENASCHFAFGEAYPCFSDAREISEDEKVKRGKNSSIIHVDFMVGTSDLSIIATTHDNKEIPIFIDGDFAF